MRRLAGLVLLCLVVGGGAVDAALADSSQVTIVTAGGGRHTLSLAALAGSEDVVGRDYTLRSGEGESTEALTGFSIAALLAAAGVDPYAFSYLEVQRPDGGAVQLSRIQAIEPGAFPAGPPVVYSTGTGTGFLRPAAGPEDDNAADSFASPAGLTIVMRKGASLQVRVEATPRQVEVGEKVGFRAVVERSGSGEALSYSWYFDDGSSGEGQAATHAFAKPGSYSVVVGATAAGDDTGTSAVVRIQVGKAPAGGPDREGGGHNESAGAPDHGAAAGPSGPSSPSAIPSPGLAPVPAAPPPAPVPSPAPEAKAVKKTKLVKTQQPEQTKPKPTPRRAGELVTGELLAANAAAPAPAASPQQAAARTGTPRADAAGAGGGVPGAAWGLGAVVALLGLGALAEAGGFVDLIPRIKERLR